MEKRKNKPVICLKLKGIQVSYFKNKGYDNLQLQKSYFNKNKKKWDSNRIDLNVGQAFILKDLLNQTLEKLTTKDISKFYVVTKTKQEETKKEDNKKIFKIKSKLAWSH